MDDAERFAGDFRHITLASERLVRVLGRYYSN